jgi:hypothetical protein
MRTGPDEVAAPRPGPSMSIPRIIYTTWISERPIPARFAACMRSWSRLLPGYRVVVLGLSDVVSSPWTDAALAMPRAEDRGVALSDYMRCVALLKTGGIYLDADVEVIRPLDPLLGDRFFIGAEDGSWIGSAVLGAVRGHPLLQAAMDVMDGPERRDGDQGPRIFTRLLQARGWQPRNADVLVGDVHVYGSERFYPYHWDETYTPECVTPETFAIHRWAFTWNDGTSVVIPCYNQGEFLAGAIESALSQTRPPLEVIVVNDGSSDDTSGVARRYGKAVHLIEQPNRGLSAARNIGISEARGRWVLALDADDELEPNALEKMFGDDDIVSPAVRCFGASDSVWHPPLPHPRVEDFLERNHATGAGSLFLREVWEVVGGYDEAMLDGWEDWDFWIRATHAGFSVTILPEPLLRYRTYAHSRAHRPSSAHRAREKEAKIRAYMSAKYRAAGIGATADSLGRSGPVACEVIAEFVDAGTRRFPGEEFDADPARARTLFAANVARPRRLTRSA